MGGPSEYDAGKRIKSRKRHATVDVEGFPIAIRVHAADVQDRDGAPDVILAMLEKAPEVRKLSWCQRLAKDVKRTLASSFA